jgi:hypothetical protein
MQTFGNPKVLFPSHAGGKNLCICCHPNAQHQFLSYVHAYFACSQLPLLFCHFLRLASHTEAAEENSMFKYQELLAFIVIAMGATFGITQDAFSISELVLQSVFHCQPANKSFPKYNVFGL